MAFLNKVIEVMVEVNRTILGVDWTPGSAERVV